MQPWVHCWYVIVILHRRCYKDPWQVKWEPQHKRKAIAAATASGKAALTRSNLHSAGSSRIWRDIVPPGVPPAQVSYNATDEKHQV
jgi:hypothetical protein